MLPLMMQLELEEEEEEEGQIEDLTTDLSVSKSRDVF